MVKRYSAGGASLLTRVTDQLSFEAQEGVVRRAADAVLDALIDGRLASYVEASASGRWFRIPLGYWVMMSAAENPWSVFGPLQPFSFAPGFDESMVGQQVLVSERAADALVIRREIPAADEFADENNEPVRSLDEVGGAAQKSPAADKKPKTRTGGRKTNPVWARAYAMAYKDHPAIAASFGHVQFRDWIVSRSPVRGDASPRHRTSIAHYRERAARGDFAHYLNR